MLKLMLDVSGFTVTETGADVLLPKIPSPAYRAVTLYVPPGRKSILMLPVPPLRARVPCPWLDGKDESVTMATAPLGLPEPDSGATVAEAVIAVPCVNLVDESFS